MVYYVAHVVPGVGLGDLPPRKGIFLVRSDSYDEARILLQGKYDALVLDVPSGGEREGYDFLLGVTRGGHNQDTPVLVRLALSGMEIGERCKSLGKNIEVVLEGEGSSVTAFLRKHLS